MDKSKTETETETVNRGIIRGGCNDHARFFLHVTPPDTSESELEALMAPWDEEIGLTGHPWAGWYYKLNTRREFALLPRLVRKAQAVGWRVSTTMYDEGPKGEVYLDDDPAEFWRLAACAQAHFGG